MSILRDYNAVVDPQEVGGVLSALERAKTFALDLETTGLEFKTNDIHGVALATENQEWYVSLGAEHALLPGLKDLLARPEITMIGHNLLFDCHFLRKHGIDANRIIDTMVGQFLVDENQSISLKTLAGTKLGITEPLPDFNDLRHWAKRICNRRKLEDVTIYDIPFDTLAEYAARDARLTLDLWPITAHELDREGMMQQFIETEMPFVQLLMDMEEAGFYIDQALLTQLGIDFEAKKQAALDKWMELTGGVNPNSNKQLGEYLFSGRYKPSLYTDSGAPAVDVLHLTRIKPDDKNGEITALLDYRKYDKLIGTYITSFQARLVMGRLFGNFNQTGAVTGRLSSSGPNLQNIPARGEDGSRVRELFAAPLGRCFVDIDYSQLELRILAHYCKDPSMLKVFAEGGDPHQTTLDLIAGLGYVIDRRAAKAVNFGWAYGISAKGLCDSIEKETGKRPEKKAAQSWLNGFARGYTYAPSWKRRVIEYATELGYVKTIGGRKRRLPDIQSRDEGLRGYAERQAVNSIIQGCKDADSMVLTTSGMVTLRDLHASWLADHPYTLVTFTGTEDNYVVHSTGSKPVFKVATTHGTEWITEGHRFFVYDDGDFSVRTLGELQEGDFILAASRRVPGKPTTDVSVEEAELVGVLLGGGSYTSNRQFYVSYGNNHDYAEHIKRLIRSVYGNTVHVGQRRPKGSVGESWVLVVTNRPIRQRLMELGLGQVSMENKDIPDWVFTSSTEHRLAVLRGMFDTDGGLVSGTYPRFTNISRDLAEGFLLLAQSLGYSGFISNRDGHNGCKDVWYATISGQDAQQFIDDVAPRVECKRLHNERKPLVKLPPALVRDVANLVVSSGAWSETKDVHTTIKRNTSTNTWKSRTTRYSVKANFTHHEQAHIYRMKRGSGTKDSCEMYLRRIDGTVPQEKLLNLLDLVQQPWAQIRSIEPVGFRETMDIEMIGEDHSYIGNGLLQHNSAADIIKWAMLKIHPLLKTFDTLILAQVHDEICLESPASVAQEFGHKAAKLMVQAGEHYNMRVKLIAEPGIGPNWANAKH